MDLNEVRYTGSQLAATSKRHARRLLSIYKNGNNDRYNPRKALRDLTQDSAPIIGVGGPHVSQPTPSEAKAMLIAAGINPDSEDPKRSIELSGLPDESDEESAANKRDYIPGWRNRFNPSRRYGDGQRRMMGQLWTPDLVPYIRAYQRAMRNADSRSMRKIASYLYRKRGIRIGGRAVPNRNESKESNFLKLLDEALGL